MGLEENAIGMRNLRMKINITAIPAITVEELYENE